METFEIPLHPLLVFMVVLARVGGLVTFAPFWSHNAATPKIRILLAFALSIALTPVITTKIATPPDEIYAFSLVLLGELMIGMALGFVGKLIFSGFEMAAYLIGSQMGFALAGTIDPSTRAQTTAFGTIAQMMGLMVLLGADGHHWFLAATVKSFSAAEPGSFIVSAELLDIFLRLSANAIAVGVSLAAPALIVLLAVELALEFFGRTAPQFQVFILGFPIKIAIGLWLIGAALFFMPNAFRDVLGEIYNGLNNVLGVI
ncbi:MAG: flagellar biosynthetic protein FliR [Pyrinomonadaceae bacterium]|nr:flagellar biosynthetic protein FliR [Pyrinomonadaceae bacterium]